MYNWVVFHLWHFEAFQYAYQPGTLQIPWKMKKLIFRQYLWHQSFENWFWVSFWNFSLLKSFLSSKIAVKDTNTYKSEGRSILMWDWFIPPPVGWQIPHLSGYSPLDLYTRWPTADMTFHTFIWPYKPYRNHIC